MAAFAPAAGVDKVLRDRIVLLARGGSLLGLRALLQSRLLSPVLPVAPALLALRDASHQLRGLPPGPASSRQQLPALPASAEGSYFLGATLAAMAGAPPPLRQGRASGVGWHGLMERQAKASRAWDDPATVTAGWRTAGRAWRRGLRAIQDTATLAAVYDLVGIAICDLLHARADTCHTHPDSALVQRLVEDAAQSTERLDLHRQALRDPAVWPGMHTVFFIAASRSGPSGLVPLILARIDLRELAQRSQEWLQALEGAATQGRLAWLAREPAVPLVRRLLALAQHPRPGAAAQARRFPGLAWHLYRWLQWLGPEAGRLLLPEVQDALPRLSALTAQACRQGLAQAGLTRPAVAAGDEPVEPARVGPDSVLYRAWGHYAEAGELVLDPAAFRLQHEVLLARVLREGHPQDTLGELQDLYRLLVLRGDAREEPRLRGARQEIAGHAREALERTVAAVRVHPPRDAAAQAEAAHLRRTLARMLAWMRPLGGLPARAPA